MLELKVHNFILTELLKEVKYLYVSLSEVMFVLSCMQTPYETFVADKWLSYCGIFVVRLQLSDIINEFVECQGQCWTIAQRNPRAKERGPT